MDTQSSASFEASYRSLMTAFFAGIANTFLCLLYNIGFRSGRRYFSSTLLNVSYIIFGMLFLFFIIGLIYMLIRRTFRKGDLIFFLLFSVVTVLAIGMIRSGHFSADPIENASLRGEYTGVSIISGICAAIGIPLLYRSRKFELYVV
jgi:hypothetical protein